LTTNKQVSEWPLNRTLPLLGRWSDHLLQARGLAASTVESYRRQVEQAIGADDDLAAIDYGHLESHLRDLFVAGRSESTRATAVAALRSFFEFMVQLGELEASPARQLRAPRSYRREAPSLTAAEAARLVYGDAKGMLAGDWIEARNHTLVAVSFAVGLRVGEVGRLRAADCGYHEASGRWSVLVRRGKNAASDVRLEVRDPMVGRLLSNWLSQRLKGELCRSPALFPPAGRRAAGLSARQVHRIFQAQVERAKIQPRGRSLTFHILRHSLATLVHQAGWEIRAVQALLRHKSIKTTERYLHTSDGRLDRLWSQRNPLSPKRQRADLRRAARAIVSDLSEVLDGADRSMS
jgi:site-specific recombinase XerD